MRQRFFTWLFRTVERHRHGADATWWDRLQCDLYDWSTGMPVRQLLRERLSRKRPTYGVPPDNDRSDHS